jgi:hypothetical protein
MVYKICTYERVNILPVGPLLCFLILFTKITIVPPPKLMTTTISFVTAKIFKAEVIPPPRGIWWRSVEIELLTGGTGHLYSDRKKWCLSLTFVSPVLSIGNERSHSVFRKISVFSWWIH